MSTITTAGRVAAAAAIGLGGLIAAPPAAQAGFNCTHPGSQFGIDVSPNPIYHLFITNLADGGSDLQGLVTSTMKNENSAAGSSVGSIAGTAVNFIVTWFEPSGGGSTHFRGDIGPDGIARGTATGSKAKDSNGNIQLETGPWTSVTPLTCPGPDAAAAPAAPAAPPTNAITVKFGDPGIGSISAKVSNSSGLKANCTYDATPFDTHRDFTVPAKGSTPLTFNGLNTFTTYHTIVVCTADFNGAPTEIGRVEQDVTF
jgi:hypothetical protein